MTKPITIADLNATKKVLKFMRKDIKTAEGWQGTATLKTTDNMLMVLGWYADDMIEKIRKDRSANDKS